MNDTLLIQTLAFAILLTGLVCAAVSFYIGAKDGPCTECMDAKRKKTAWQLMLLNAMILVIIGLLAHYGYLSQLFKVVS